MSATSVIGSIVSPENSPPSPPSRGELVTLRVDLATARDYREAVITFSRTLRPGSMEAVHCVRLRERFDVTIRRLWSTRRPCDSLPMVLYAAEAVTLVLAHFETAAGHLRGACPERASQSEARGYALLRVVAVHAPVLFAQLVQRDQ